MGVGDDFGTFYRNIGISRTARSLIGERYQLITRRINLEFWNTDSRISHSFYTGSYGRGTASGIISDIDMVVQLPSDKYEQYDRYIGNGQSALLQEVSRAIQRTYPSSAVGGDGQVVVINFADGITFEVVPAFLKRNGSYLFPDANDGGSWKTTDPKPEIEEIDEMDAACNGNLKALARMARAWKAQWDVPIGGLLIDTLVYYFIRDHEYRAKSFVYYDWMSRDFFDFLRTRNQQQAYWLSPGANQYVWRKGNFEYKATRCYNISTVASDYQGERYGWTARQRWREIYGSSFPSL